jgi:hypothetical protein
MILALGAVSLSAAPVEKAATPPAHVSALPDPLPPGDLRAGPGHVPFLALGLLVFVPAGLVWGALAAQRAWQSDPFRERRSAQRALVRLLESLRDRAPTPLELEHWRRLSVRAWAMPQAVPTLAEVAAHLPETASPQIWITLWREAEEAMYSPRPELRSDWISEASERARHLPPLPSMPWWPGEARHWWPTLLVAALAGLASVSALPAADATAAYRGGHFAEAGKAWLEQVTQRPGDWSARHNAALALAQQEKWGNAAGYWTSAFVLNPQNPAIVSGLKTSLGKIETADPALRRLLEGAATDRWVAHYSVAEWQQLIGTGAFVLSVGLVALVISLYRLPSLSWRIGGGALVVIGVITTVSALTAVNRYGPLADSQAAFITRSAELRSIPSDLVGKQQTSTLFPGAIVNVHRSFLGWDQVSVGGDVAGWVRADALVWLYRTRNDHVPATILKP